MIQLKGVRKAFDDKLIFQQLDLHIKRGEFVVFCGKSGCGKTTILNLIGGLEKPDCGTVLVDGIDLSKRRAMKQYFAEKVGFLFQNFALLEDQTVRQNIELIQKKNRSGADLAEILERVGLPEKADTKVYKLSGGEQQRVALARLMFKKCDLILADEPTGSLDPENAKMVMEILHKMNQEGKTVVLVTHNETIIQEEQTVINLGDLNG